MRSFRVEGGAVVDEFDWPTLRPGGTISSFGEDAAGELYVHDLGGPGIQDRPAVTPEQLAARIPGGVRFGTSSWNYPGWRGIVYHRDYEGKGASTRMLEEYAAYPLFRTVGIDSTFYAPPTPEVLRGWAEYLPPGFPAVSKVWNQITVHTHAEAMGRSRAGQVNPDFLNPEVFLEAVYEPYQTHFARNTGPVRLRVPDHRPPERDRAAGVRRPARRASSPCCRGTGSTPSRSATRSS